MRKEHELAVKMLWQFLGVLADRLDVTSKELRAARAELSAEDVTSKAAIISEDVEDIFPVVDTGEHPRAPRTEGE